MDDPEHWEGGSAGSITIPAVESVKTEPGGSVSPGDPLQRALGALGARSSGDAERSPKGGGNPQDTPPISTPEPEPEMKSKPILTAENLPQIIEGIDKMIMTGICVAKAKHLPRQVVLDAMKMPEGDKETLAFFAPYALKYADVVMAYAEPVMAGLFVLFWGMSITGRAKDIGALSKQYAEWQQSQGGTHGPNESASNNPAESSEQPR